MTPNKLGSGRTPRFYENGGQSGDSLLCYVDTAGEIDLITDVPADWDELDASQLQGAALVTLVAETDRPELRDALERVRQSQDEIHQSCFCHLVAGDADEPVEIELRSASRAPGDAVLASIEPQARRLSATERTQLGELFARIDDAVVEFELVDGEPVVHSVNPAFEDVFGFDAERVVGESLTAFIMPPDGDGDPFEFDTQTASKTVNYKRVRRQTAAGLREFLYRGIPYTRGDGRQYGFAIYTDVTEQKQAEQQLHVLHRLFRHNLRNEMSIILGLADEIQQTTATESIQRAAARISHQARKLTTLSDKTQAAERVIEDSASDTVVDITERVRRVVDEANETWPEATIMADLGTALPVTTSGSITTAIANLVENAIQHNDEEPTVRVTTRRDAPIQPSTRSSEYVPEAVVSVSDNGPGLPATERKVIFEDADITQLSHGSGIGLWLVRWVTEAADGRLEYERKDGWTTITLRLPVETGSSPSPPNSKSPGES